MKRLLTIFVGVIVWNACVNKIYAIENLNNNSEEITISANNGDIMQFSILSEEDRTVEIISYTFCEDTRNMDILNIPAKVLYEGKTYFVTTIPKYFDVKYYPHYSFYEEPEPIKILNISNGIKYIDDNTFKYWHFVEVNLPPTLLEIGSYAFYMPIVEYIQLEPMHGGAIREEYPHDMTGPLIISNFVKKLNLCSFDYDNFSSVTLGQNIKTIEPYIFGKAENLICCATIPPIFDYLYDIWKNKVTIIYLNNTNLFVPPGCKEIYEQDENWGKAASIEEYEYYVNVEFDDLDILSHKILKGRLFKGQTRTLHPKITWLHEGSSERFRYWSSSDENVATVDQNGVITAKDFGEATITLMIEDERGVPFNCSYDVLVTTSADVDIIESDDADTAVEVFTLNGLKVGDTTDNLPAGFYIVKSAREARKICIK